MNLPATLFVLRWLVRDTFRQALAARTLWLMLSLSAVCIVLCLSVSIDNGQSLRPDGEIGLYGGDDQPLAGPNPKPGHWSLAFGAFRLALFRDGEAQVHFLQTMLAFWVAGTLGTLIALIWTAGFLPSFLEPSAAAVLLAKPVPRWLLLSGKFVGVLIFVAFQEIVFFGGTWLALGWRTGVWNASYLWCIPLLLLHFGIIYSFSALMAVCTRSTVASIFGAVLFWFFCFAMNYGRHAVVTLPALAPTVAPYTAGMKTMAEAGYWIMPKPGDVIILLDSALQAGDDFDVTPQVFKETVKQGQFDAALSVLSSVLCAVVIVGIAARQLVTTDY